MLLPLLLLLSPQDPPPIEYRGGLRTANDDGGVRLRINGRAMYDWIDPSGGLESVTSDRNEFRRVRLLVQGTVGEHLGGRLQWDFTDSEEELLEGMLDWRTFPLGTLRVGHFREPAGLDARTSSAQLTFLERSAPTDAFTAGRNRGAQLRDRDERWSWAVGLFRSSDSPFPDEGLGEEESLTARVTWLPRRAEDDGRLVHLGLSVTSRDPQGDGLRFAARPGAHLIERLVDTGTLPADGATIVGLEGALVEGPLSTQAELFLSEVDLPGADGQPWGVSIMGSWILTGEHRTYRDSASSVGSPRVRNSVFAGGGGAWELATRWSRTDLDEGGVQGGTMEDVTLGLNWYLSQHARVMLDYLHVHLEDSNQCGDALLLRLHLGF